MSNWWGTADPLQPGQHPVPYRAVRERAEKAEARAAKLTEAFSVERIEALCKLLEGDGHMTPVASRQFVALAREALREAGKDGVGS